MSIALAVNRMVLHSKGSQAGAPQVSWQLPPNVLLVAGPDGGARLLDLDGSFHALSAIGTEMLQKTLTDGVDAAVEQIVQRYGADAAQVRADLESYLARLQRRQLLCRKGGLGRRQYCRLAVLTLVPALWFVCHCVPLAGVRRFLLLMLALVSFRWYGWSATIAAWKRAFPQGRSSHSQWRQRQTAQVVDDEVCRAAAGHLFTMECKERALCCWALARMSGLPAALVVGIQFFPLAGHCWCESGSWTLSDGLERCRSFQPVLRYV